MKDKVKMWLQQDTGPFMRIILDKELFPSKQKNKINLFHMLVGKSLKTKIRVTFWIIFKILLIRSLKFLSTKMKKRTNSRTAMNNNRNNMNRSKIMMKKLKSLSLGDMITFYCHWTKTMKTNLRKIMNRLQKSIWK